MRVSARSLVVELAVVVVCSSLHAEQLPLRRYTTVDGLASNAVYSIVSDSRGFLWFATAEGISRFDGFGFANQTEITGLPRSLVTQVLVGRHGNYWLATTAGLVRFRPDLPTSSGGRMVLIRAGGQPESPRISVLLEDRAGVLWCGTAAGLYVVDDPYGGKPALAEVRVGLPGLNWGDSEVRGLAQDSEGGMWIGAADGTLYHRLPDGRVERRPPPEKSPGGQITRLLSDRKGRIWVGRVDSLYRSAPAPHPGENGFERLTVLNYGSPQGRVYDIFESREGDVWVGMYRSLAQFPSDGAPVRVWTKENGLPSRGVGTLGQDRDGNLWMGGDSGAFKLAAGGLLTYSTGDGIGMDAVISIAETLDGELYMAGRQESGAFRIGIHTAGGFQTIAPRVPRPVDDFGWRPARVILQDRGGEWWLASSQGLCRYPRLESPLQLARTLPKAVYTNRDGLPADLVTRLYEDQAGNIWIGSETARMVYWSRTGRKFVEIAADGAPSFASAFGQDGAGHIWIGDEAGQLWRVQDGRAFRMAGLASTLHIRAFLLDRAGRLWVATEGQGLLRFDRPAAASPQFRQYGYSDGLSSLILHSLAEDANGFLYIGTDGGVDRLDPDVGHVRHYTFVDGIAPGEVISAYRDRTGIIWFGTNHGLTRMVPQNGPPSVPPPVWITGLSIAGRPAPVSETGEPSVRRVQIEPGQEHIQFDFVGLSYSSGSVLRYQYRLGNEAWSAPIESRSVHYGALAPGKYRFAVRAVNSDGDASPAPATVEFQVVPPLWRRAWFQAILVALAMGCTVSVHRMRAARLLAIERVRSNIALDLHDDIASNLSQITIFSEIALRATSVDSLARESMARIAETARDTVESIGDIVWSIQPQMEGDLLQRIRRFGSDALTSRQIDGSFHFSEEVRHLTLDPIARRQVYLVYKEAVHNTVRHACATAVKISVAVVGPHLVLSVCDNGRGFQSPGDGNGLPGMRARATSIGGKLSIRSAAGKGTEVELRVPWKAPGRFRILPR